MSIALCQCSNRIDTDNDNYTTEGFNYICEICLEGKDDEQAELEQFYSEEEYNGR